MGIRHGLMGLLALGLATGPVAAQSIEQTSFLFRRPPACDICGTPASGPLTVMPVDPNSKDQAPALDSQAFAQAPAAGGEGGMSFNPAMFGDLAGNGRGTVLQTRPGQNSTGLTFAPSGGSSTTGSGTGNSSSSGSTTTGGSTTTTNQNVVSNTITRQTQVPIFATGSFKISDNESPRPTDRVFFTYNYFDRITSGPNVGLNRELIGFEKTFLDSNASFGMRLPFLQTTSGSGVSGFASHEVGDLTLISKYAFINDRETGNLISGGLVLTVPSADHSFVLADGTALRSVLFQPYAGWIVNSGDFYAHGFHALVAPTDRRDITEFNNDVGIGVWAYRSESFVRGVVPTVEGHLFTPLNHQNNTNIITASNIFTITAGVNAVFAGNSSVGIAIGVPITGPRPDNVEALVSFNLRF